MSRRVAPAALAAAGLTGVALLFEPGDGYLVPEGSDGLADELLISKGAVCLSCVKQGDATIEGRANDLDRFLPVCGWAVDGFESHASIADGGDLDTVSSEDTLLHTESYRSTSVRERAQMPRSLEPGATSAVIEIPAEQRERPSGRAARRPTWCRSPGPP